MNLNTKRLELIPCTLNMILQIINTELDSEELFGFSTSKKELAKLKKIAPVFKGLLKYNKEKYYWYMWIVVLKRTNTIIGDIGFKGGPNSQGIIDLGYSIDIEYRKNGFATESVKELVKWAFKSNEIKKISAVCKEDNINSIKILKKINMKITLNENGFIYWELEK